MKLETLTEKIGARILHQGCCTSSDIARFYAGDKMSDLLNQASATTLIVTNLLNSQLLRFADIMDVPGICLLNDVNLTEDMITILHDHKSTILVAPGNMEETCQRLRQYLQDDVREGACEEQ
jgi:hypothetical protein